MNWRETGRTPESIALSKAERVQDSEFFLDAEQTEKRKRTLDIAALKDKSVTLGQFPSDFEEKRDCLRPRFRAAIGAFFFAIGVSDFILPGVQSLLVHSLGFLLAFPFLLWDLARFPNHSSLQVFLPQEAGNRFEGIARFLLILSLTTLFAYCAYEALNYQNSRKERLRRNESGVIRLVKVHDLKKEKQSHFVVIHDASDGLSRTFPVRDSDFEHKLRVGQTLRMVATRENPQSWHLADLEVPSNVAPEWSHSIAVALLFLLFWYGYYKRWMIAVLKRLRIF